MTADLDVTSRSLETWAAEAEAAAGIARALAPTAFIPDSLRVRDPDNRNRVDLDATVSQVAAALLTGQELGLSPMASLRSIDVIPPGSGSPALRAHTMRALAMSRGHEIWFAEPPTDTRVIMRGRRFGSDPDLPPAEANWQIDRVAKMRLRGFASPDSHWKRQPRTMLIARATGEIVRLIAPEVLLGLPYAVEELDDAGAYDAGDAGEPDNALSPPSAPARRKTRRQSTPARRRAGSPAALPAANTPPGDDAAEDTEPAGEPQPMITASQRARLWAGLRRLGLTERDPALARLSEWIGRELDSSNSLTEAEAGDVLREIEAQELRDAARQAAEDAEAAQDEPDRPEVTDDDR